MKKIIFPLICLAFFIGALFFMFNNLKEGEPAPVATSTPVTGIMRVEEQKFATTTDFVKIDIDYPKFVGDYFQVEVINEVNKRIEDYALEGIDDFIMQAEREVGQLQKDFPKSARAYENQITYTLLPLREDLVQVEFQSYLDTGGAHGSHGVSVYKLDRATGKAVEEKDVFVNVTKLEGDIDSLIEDEIIAEKMKRLSLSDREARDNWEKVLEDSKSQGGIKWSAFALKDEGIEFYFSHYILGAYVEGEYRATVPWNSLAPYLQTRYK